MKSNGALVRKYRLDYGEYDASSGRSHLTAVQEYGSDGVSTLPAQTFGWLQGGQTLAWQRWATQQGGWGTTPFLASDFNGDGLADVAFVFPDQGDISIDLHESTGDSFDWQRWATQQGGWQGSAPFFVGDFNGDGKADIAYVFEDVGGTISMDVHEPALFAERRISPRGGMSTPPAPFGKAPGSAAERGQVSRALSGHMQSA